MNGVHQIHNKSVETTQNNGKICNISFPKRFIRVINHSLDRTQLDPLHNGLSSSVSCTSCTTYGDTYLRIVHGDSFKKSRLGPCDVYVHRNLKQDHGHPGSPLFWFHSTSNKLVLSDTVSCVRLGLLTKWHICILT